MLEKTVTILVLVTLTGIYLYSSLTKSEEGHVVKTKSGSVRGILSRSRSRDGREYYEWLGIRYAEPPVGSLRFASPKPVTKWKGIRDASSLGSKCPQIDFVFGTVDGAEDCLFLNIYVPKVEYKKEKLLPVLVYIHGGAFALGSGALLFPNYLMDQEMLLISFNYRLNVFGFLSTGDQNIRGNMGLKDQVLALKFIKKNVINFGGDPNQITIYGPSAGAASVHYLTMVESTKGLFKKAIMTSGTAITTWALDTTEEAIEKTKSIASDLNCPTNDSTALLECLRSLNYLDLLSAYGKIAVDLRVFNPSKDGELFSPTIETVDDEEAFLTQNPYDILIQGRAHRIPFMIGLNRDEGLLTSLAFYADDKALDLVESNWETSMKKLFEFSRNVPPEKIVETLKQMRQFYFNGSSNRDEIIAGYTKMFSDGLFFVGASEVASIQKQFSHVYTYFYTKTGGPSISTLFADLKKGRFHPLTELTILGAKTVLDKYILKRPPKDYGIFHAEDTSMLSPLDPFLAIKKNEEDPNYKFSKDFVKLFYNFIQSDETKLDFRGTKWSPNDKKGDLMYLEVKEKPQIIPEPFLNETLFWRSLNYTHLFNFT